MTDVDHHQLVKGFSDILSNQNWERIGEYIADDVIWEFPQSGERFRGLANVRAQFENYPDLDPGASELKEVIGGTEYALTQMYTLVAVQGSGDRGTSIIRVHYPDGSYWWAINLYEVRNGKIFRSRSFFAPEFEPPDWRAPYRDAEV